MGYDGAQSDLTLVFLEVIKKLSIKKCNGIQSEAAIVGYIHKCMINKYIFLSKKSTSISMHETELNLDIAYENNFTETEDKIFIRALLDKLSYKEKQVVSMRYLNGFSDEEIGKSLNITRQAVSKTRNKALESMRRFV